VKTILNIIWLVFAGLWLALGYLIAAVLMAITIIGIPLGVGSFKMAGAALVPFGRQVVKLEELAEPPQGAIAISG
jgi:uncharacterized membrane protein YccF (DUF307 family)